MAGFSVSTSCHTRPLCSASLILSSWDKYGDINAFSRETTTQRSPSLNLRRFAAPRVCFSCFSNFLFLKPSEVFEFVSESTRQATSFDFESITTGVEVGSVGGVVGGAGGGRLRAKNEYVVICCSWPINGCAKGEGSCCAAAVGGGLISPAVLGTPEPKKTSLYNRKSREQDY
jgi:hypothetical protein